MDRQQLDRRAKLVVLTCLAAAGRAITGMARDTRDGLAAAAHGLRTLPEAVRASLPRTAVRAVREQRTEAHAGAPWLVKLLGAVQEVGRTRRARTHAHGDGR